MKKFIGLAVVAIASVLVVASLASANHAAKKPSAVFVAVLNSGQEIRIADRHEGRRVRQVHRNTFAPTSTWKLTFGHLTGPATAAHIHSGLKGKAGPVLIPLRGTGCTSPASGTVTVTSAQVPT